MSAQEEPATPDPRQRNQYRIESLAKGLQVLRLFDETTTSLRLREIVERTSLPMPTATFGAGQGPNAVTSRAALDAQLREVRAQGSAIQDQELALGLRSVAVPVFAGGPQPVAAINVAVSVSRHDVDALRGPLLERVIAAANEIGLRLAAA